MQRLLQDFLQLLQSESSKLSEWSESSEDSESNQGDILSREQQQTKRGGEQPPHKVSMSENEKGGEKVSLERRMTEPREYVHKQYVQYVHKQRRTDKKLVPPNAPRRARASKSKTKNPKVGASSSNNINISGIPKKSKSAKTPQSLVDTDFGYTSQQILEQQDISSSSNEGEHKKLLRTNPVKLRSQVPPELSPAAKKKKHHQKQLKKKLTDNEDFDNMEEMFMLEDATRPISKVTSWEDLVDASKFMRSPKLEAPSEAWT